MPFTLTHTLAVIPIRYAWSRLFPFSALAIGAMIPDWPLFISSGVKYEATHSIPGLFFYCFPVGLGVYFVYRYFLKIALFELLPLGFKERLSIYRCESFLPSRKSSMFIVLAVLIGAATHIIWDEFTHDTGWGLKLLPLLNSPVLVIAGHEIYGYKLFQYGSTLIGLPVLLTLFVRWYKKADRVKVVSVSLSEQARSIIVSLMLIVPLSISLVSFFVYVGSSLAIDDVPLLLFHFISVTTVILMLEIVIYSAAFALCKFFFLERQES